MIKIKSKSQSYCQSFLSGPAKPCGGVKYIVSKEACLGPTGQKVF